MAINTDILHEVSNNLSWSRSASTKEELDTAVHTLQEHKALWVEKSLKEKIEILDKLIQIFGTIREDWVTRNLEAKDASLDPYAVGLEWIEGPVVMLRYLQGLRKALKDISVGSVPEFTGPVTTQNNGQVVAKIYPTSLYERLATPGVTAEVWMEQGVSVDKLAETQAIAYKKPQKSGRVVLVLGGGNIAGIPINDSLTKLFVENQVVLLKMNPVNEYLGPLIKKWFDILVTGGFFKIVFGGSAEGNYLCHHPGVDEIHLTGSDKTHDMIVFGAGIEGKERKQAKHPLITKRFTSELGNIAPAIVVPGPWQYSELRFQAEQLASHLCDNAGYSCSRTRVILNHANWPLREKLLQTIREVMLDVPLRNAYYPGAHDLQEAFISAHPERIEVGIAEGQQLPWTLIADVNPHNTEDICFTTESFCPVIAETALEANSVPEFIDAATDFANHCLWGTLSAAIIVHPNSLKDPMVATAVNRAIMNLRVGNVVINGIPGMAWALATPPWGSFPGNEIQDIQSGIGYVHNVFMFARPEKTVVRCPFKMWPKPIWFNSRAKAYQSVAKKISDYAFAPSWWKIPGIFLAALQN